MKISQKIKWKQVVLYSVLGPFVGAMPILLATSINAGEIIGLKLIGAILGWAYLVGIVPATLTGLLIPVVLGLLPQQYRRTIWASLLLATSVGFIVSWVLFSSPFGSFIKTGPAAILGALSALVCMVASLVLREGPSIKFEVQHS